ncbi:MazG nucleotide pyrophosphohydrolase domain-containing protein [Legionella fairfieldensis]|uniref:MazG nucleotide pyrophosphohydrolase domain-containing protein n=1 Tax=Legionella fairfieldensis TaxID=45064 RepID=UPI000566BD8E|nr:MazG nucleotide pyrophosphohydrolase domain-containing protein [Legionella fairfieldensis]
MSGLLEKIAILEHEAAEFGFQWETTDQIMEQIKSECVEVIEHLKSEHKNDRSALQEEIGDLLHAVFSLCVFCQFSPEETLEKTVGKFERRFHAVKAIAQQKHLPNLQGKPFNELMAIWREAKSRVG